MEVDDTDRIAVSIAGVGRRTHELVQRKSAGKGNRWWWSGEYTEIQQAIGPHEDLLTMVKRCKLHWYGHVSRSSGLAKTILQDTVKGGKKTRQTEEEVGRQHRGMDRPGVRQVPEGSGEQGKMEETCCEIICGAPDER